MTSLSLSSMTFLANMPTTTTTNMVETPRTNMVTFMRRPSNMIGGGARRLVVAQAVPDKLSGVVEESIKNAQETCSESPESGECAAAWDEVEEVSAAASHARDKQKVTDPLETYCNDNPETDECRTYDN